MLHKLIFSMRAVLMELPISLSGKSCVGDPVMVLSVKLYRHPFYLQNLYLHVCLGE